MTVEIPAGLADQTRDDDNPATVDISQPMPDDIGAAVSCLWAIVRGQRDELAELRRQRM